VRAASGVVRADLAFSTGGAEGPVASVRDGLESRITFTLRCYEHRSGLAGLLGDLLLGQRTVVRVAFYDVLDRRFVVEQDLVLGVRDVAGGGFLLNNGVGCAIFTHS